MKRDDLRGYQDALNEVVLPIPREVHDYLKILIRINEDVRHLADELSTISGLNTFREASGPGGGGEFAVQPVGFVPVPGVLPQYPGITTDKLNEIYKRIQKLDDASSLMIRNQFYPLYSQLLDDNKYFLLGAIAMPPSASPGAGGSGKPGLHKGKTRGDFWHSMQNRQHGRGLVRRC